MHGMEVATYAVRNEAEIVQAIETFAREPGGGLIPLPSELIALKRELIISLAAKHRLPNIYAFRYYPESGGLASYGVDNIDAYRSAPDYIDRISLRCSAAHWRGQYPLQEITAMRLSLAQLLPPSVPSPDQISPAATNDLKLSNATHLLKEP